MINEDYVSFETARLLKEKGFNVWGDGSYDSGIEIYKEYSPSGLLNSCATSKPHPKGYPAPTLQLAMKWIKENYCLYIDIELLSGPSFSWYIWFMNDPKHMMGCSEDTMHYYDTYEEACEAGIKYCLENLI